MVQSWSNSPARDALAQAEAISKSQAVISSTWTARGVLSYPLAEIRGRHHSMFVAPTERDTGAYRARWDSLNRGEYQAGEYKRVAAPRRKPPISVAERLHRPDFDHVRHEVLEQVLDAVLQRCGR